MDTRIYVMTHKEMENISDQMYIPLQVGRACGRELGYIGDDTGDHISEKNPYYCELTGIYWLWKNIECDIVGVCHYRRYFTKGEKLLDKDYIEQTLEKFPILIPNSSCVKDADVYEHYAKRHYAKDLDLCRDVIQERYPDYLTAFDYAMQTILVSIGNMWITRKDIFDRYCVWLFDILFEVEKRIDWTDYDDYQKRVMGFLAERLFRVWLFMQPEAVTEENVQMAEASDFLREEKRRELLYRYVRLKTDPVVRLHQTNSNETLAQPLRCADDFDGKIPVWVCWWQGEEEMPELIRCCKKSLEENLPADKTALRWITLENCGEYVTFTESVIRKFNEGKISYAHLSELLRAELLFRYGGMWVDASYYLTRPAAPEIFEQEIYMLKGLWYSVKGKKLFWFLMESLWYYWDLEDKLADDSLTDILIAIAVEEFPEVRQELEQCAKCSEDIFGMQSWMNRRYTPERMKKILSDSSFYRLDYRAAYRNENMAGEKTIYGYLCGQ